MKETFPLIAKTSFGFEDLLVDELKFLGARNIQKATRAVLFDGDTELMYKVNLWSRISLRVLKPIGSFPAGDEQQLYEGIKRIEWSKYMEPDETLAVDAVVNRSKLSHSLYVAQKTKDGIVDQFRNRMGQRPNVDLRKPTLRIHVHLSEDVASISLDSSGESLHKRGYRQQQGDAPLNETLAAGLVLLSNWDRRSGLTDLMCGSGTILIEAGLLARNIAPGIFRTEFGFERWKDFDEELWKRLREDAESSKLESLPFRLTGIERDHQVIEAAKENIRFAGLSNDIDLHNMSFQGYTPEVLPTVIISNPPYGLRITTEDLFQLYTDLGASFKKVFPGVTAWVLTANKEASHKIGLKPSRKIPVFNGAIECRFMKFELYSGSRKFKAPIAEE
ncbi:MAG TPA: THUMP domain-containing protein [Bacteroidia bacterium]|nr:THUMP domain-containing protein [Bacteroidia bacterium]HNS11262.1 THUMP domain-containing protein [Bacteroidia bacterium]